MTYKSTKTFQPLSCAFRQHGAKSHCRLIHGYGLQITVEFSAHKLDRLNWVIDFGGLGELRSDFEVMFDHTYIAASDDPELPMLQTMATRGLISLRVFNEVSCERFAEWCMRQTRAWLKSCRLTSRVWVSRVEVREHSGNAATVIGEEP